TNDGPTRNRTIRAARDDRRAPLREERLRGHHSCRRRGALELREGRARRGLRHARPARGQGPRHLVALRPDARARRPIQTSLPSRVDRRARAARIRARCAAHLRRTRAGMGAQRMDRQMETRPTALAEAVVRALVPPASREHVLGDLQERCTSTRQYLLDALAALPFIVGSRIRRTTHPIGFVFIVAFLWFAVFYGPWQKSWLTAFIPSVV